MINQRLFRTIAYVLVLFVIGTSTGAAFAQESKPSTDSRATSAPAQKPAPDLQNNVEHANDSLGAGGKLDPTSDATVVGEAPDLQNAANLENEEAPPTPAATPAPQATPFATVAPGFSPVGWQPGATPMPGGRPVDLIHGEGSPVPPSETKSVIDALLKAPPEPVMSPTAAASATPAPVGEVTVPGGPVSPLPSAIPGFIPMPTPANTINIEKGSTKAVDGSAAIKVMEDTNATPVQEKPLDPLVQHKIVVETQVAGQDIPARTMFVELNKVDAAHGYDINIEPFEQKWGQAYVFHLEDEHLRVRLTPGHYKIKTRSYDDRGYPGRWGAINDFWVRFRAPNIYYPADGTVIRPMADRIEHLTFEWPVVRFAKLYLVKLLDAQGKVLRAIRTPNTWANMDLPVNNEYSWTVRAFSALNEQDDPTEPTPLRKFRIEAPSEEKRPMFFELSGPTKGATKYQFEFVKFLNKDETTPPSLFESYEPNFRVRLQPGEYEMRVREMTDNGKIGDWGPPHRFWVAMLPPKPISPSFGEEIEPDEGRQQPVLFKWKPWAEAGRYHLYVYDEKGKIVRDGETVHPMLWLTVPHMAHYTWQVVAYSPREPDRPAPPANPNINKFSLSEYIRVILSAAEEPAQWYGWGRYIITSTNYFSKNFDQNSKVTNKVVGGSGEVASGYWIRKTNFGLLGQAAMSGFNIGSQTFTYKDAALNLGYRHIFDSGASARLWVGAGYRELPEVLGNPSTQRYTMSHIKTLGPQVQLSVVTPYNDVLGWYTYGIAYYGARDMGTPTGQPQTPRYSYQVGIGGTLKLNERFTGMMGYSYKSEHAQYNSTDRTGLPNEVDFTGHYLNLILEFAISKPNP